MNQRKKANLGHFFSWAARIFITITIFMASASAIDLEQPLHS
jgi:hypothetical protein